MRRQGLISSKFNMAVGSCSGILDCGVSGQDCADSKVVDFLGCVEELGLGNVGSMKLEE